MTQSLTSAAADTPAPPVTTTSPARSRRRWSYAGAALAVLALAVVGFRAVEWARTTRVVTQADKFTVGPRSFSVVLKEKGELQAAKATEITCEVEGRSTIIYLVPEGTAVKKGDLLVELASDAIEDRIRQAELREANAVAAYEAAKAELDIQRDRNASDIRKAKLQIELAELELKKYAEGEWAQQLKDAQIAIDQARINLKRREEDYKSAQELYKRDFITKTQYQEDEFNYQKAKWDLEKALKAKEVLESYTHVAALRKRESDLEEAKKEAERVIKNAEALELQKQRNLEGKKKELDLIRAELAKYRAQREKCRITAPTQGFVVYYSGGGRHFMSNDTQIREGATVHERQVLMTLPDTSEMIVVVRVHEAKTDKLRLGQRAVVRVEGMPGKTFTGTVTKIAAVADTQNRWLNPDLKEYETHITLDPTDAQLKPGVTAYVQIEVETVENVLAVPVQSIYAKGGRRYVFRQNGDEPEPVPVKVGAIGTAWAEIREGLQEGDRVLLAFNEQHMRLIPDLPVEHRAGMGGAKGRSARNTWKGKIAGPPPRHGEGGKPMSPQQWRKRRPGHGGKPPARSSAPARPAHRPKRSHTG